MALSDTARRILAEAAQHPLCLAVPPEKLPTAACQAVLNSLLRQGYVEECVAPDDLTAPRWRLQDGNQLMARITEVGMAALRATPNTTATRSETDAAHDSVPQEANSAPLAAPTAPEPLEPPASAKAPALRPNLRDAARRVLAGAITALRAILVKTTPTARATSIRKPRKGTKQQQVLAMLRRP